MYINNDIRYLSEMTNVNSLKKRSRSEYEFQTKIGNQTSDNNDRFVKENTLEYQNYLEYGNYNKLKYAKLKTNSENINKNEDKEDINKKETSKSETKSNIIVKPDGSRVLIMTMQFGGMESTISLQISKPTDFANSETELDSKTEEIGNQIK